jgi:hypothetical protein
MSKQQMPTPPAAQADVASSVPTPSADDSHQNQGDPRGLAFRDGQRAAEALPEESDEPVVLAETPGQKGVEVIAVAAGYYKQMRIAEGERFMIDNMKQWGKWMKLADPKAEAARVKKQAEEDEAARKERVKAKQAGK